MTLHGADVSIYQGPSIDWAAAKAAGISFAICKRSEGIGGIDATFDRNWSELGRLGLCRGAYHYGHLDDPLKEAAFFLAQLPALQPGDIVVLDCESGSGDMTAKALAFLQHVEAALGFPPLLYTYPAFVNQSLTGNLSHYPLWLADLAGTVARIGHWPFVALRQYTWEAYIPGILGNVDGDVLERDIMGLKALGKPAPVLTWAVAKSGALKQQASHSSAVAIGPDHKPFPPLTVGTIVVPTGPVVTTDDVWQGIKIPHSPVHGYYVAANLKAV